MHRVLTGVFPALVFLLATLYHNEGFAASDALEACEDAFAKLPESASLDERIAGLGALEEQCHDTGFFELRMGELYIRNREYSKASRIIKRGLTSNTPFDKELLLAKGNIDLHRKDYSAAEEAYRAVTDKYPDWNTGFDYLGFALFAQGQNEKAVEYLDKANSLGESAASYRTLTLAHYLLENHEQSIESLNRAFSLDESILADRDPMVAGIRSYAEVGKFDISRSLLSLLLNRNPEVENDEEFIKAGLFLRQKMADAGVIEE